MREINKIIVHCSATKPSMDIGKKEINDWHVAKGWDGIGYHYVIRRNGVVSKGRDISKAGAHAKGHNFGSIGVCLVGGVDNEGIADDNFTIKQYNSLYQLIKFLFATFPAKELMGHRDLPNVNKSCPCFDVSAWYERNNT
tara:strand:+ start:43 stop:462 length:420 start_codon:yes stop_codon:yes gene_type:complete